MKTPAKARATAERHISVSPWRYWAIFMLATYWVLLCTSTHVPRLPQSVELSNGIDKVCHFLGFTVLAFLASVAWSLNRPSSRPLRMANFAAMFVVLATYGVADELTQLLVGRSCEFGDWLADLLGSAVGMSLFVIGASLGRRIPTAA